MNNAAGVATLHSKYHSCLALYAEYRSSSYKTAGIHYVKIKTITSTNNTSIVGLWLTQRAAPNSSQLFYSKHNSCLVLYSKHSSCSVLDKQQNNIAPIASNIWHCRTSAMQVVICRYHDAVLSVFMVLLCCYFSAVYWCYFGVALVLFCRYCGADVVQFLSYIWSPVLVYSVKCTI